MIVLDPSRFPWDGLGSTVASGRESLPSIRKNGEFKGVFRVELPNHLTDLDLCRLKKLEKTMPRATTLFGLLISNGFEEPGCQKR